MFFSLTYIFVLESIKEFVFILRLLIDFPDGGVRLREWSSQGNVWKMRQGVWKQLQGPTPRSSLNNLSIGELIWLSVKNSFAWNFAGGGINWELIEGGAARYQPIEA